MTIKQFPTTNCTVCKAPTPSLKHISTVTQTHQHCRDSNACAAGGMIGYNTTTMRKAQLDCGKKCKARFFYNTKTMRKAQLNCGKKCKARFFSNQNFSFGVNCVHFFLA